MDATMWAQIWSQVALVLFLALVIYLGAPKMIGKSLDDRAAKIKAELDAAKTLREEAESLLAEYQKKRKEAEAEAEEILAAAKREASTMAADAKVKTEEYVARRTALSEQKIKAAETDAVNAVRAAAVDLAVAAAEKLIAAKVDAKADAALFANSVSEVKTRLN
ncbi:MAG: F0F1 ATP synthase subunit B [Rhizobiaceae bacterium]|nr:F0F1 ATP synthase subunit B [Rhizobiaceae bacterium]